MTVCTASLPVPQDLVIPIAIDNSLPDYLVRAEGYAERMRVQWQPGDRFRMFFGGKISSKTHKKVKTGGAGSFLRLPLGCLFLLLLWRQDVLQGAQAGQDR